MMKVRLPSVSCPGKPPSETYMLNSATAKEKTRRAKLKAKMEAAGRAGR